MPSITGSYRTPYWAALERKDKSAWFGGYSKHWCEIRVSTAGDNEVWLTFSPAQGAATTEELSLLNAEVNAKPTAKHAGSDYCEVTFAPKKRCLKLKCDGGAGDMGDFYKALSANVAGIKIDY
jgi:hypothetical protein